MLGEPQYKTFTEAACLVCGKKSTGRTYMAAVLRVEHEDPRGRIRLRSVFGRHLRAGRAGPCSPRWRAALSGPGMRLFILLPAPPSKLASPFF